MYVAWTKIILFHIHGKYLEFYVAITTNIVFEVFPYATTPT